MLIDGPLRDIHKIEEPVPYIFGRIENNKINFTKHDKNLHEA